MSTMPPAEKNALADAQAARITHFSLHTGATGTGGANEASGGSYARVASNFAAAGAVGPLGSALQPATDGIAWGSATFNANAGTYTDVGMWNASSAGTFRSGDDLSAAQVLGSAGTVGPLSIKVGPAA